MKERVSCQVFVIICRSYRHGNEKEWLFRETAAGEKVWRRRHSKRAPDQDKMPRREKERSERRITNERTSLHTLKNIGTAFILLFFFQISTTSLTDLAVGDISAVSTALFSFYSCTAAASINPHRWTYHGMRRACRTRHRWSKISAGPYGTP